MGRQKRNKIQRGEGVRRGKLEEKLEKVIAAEGHSILKSENMQLERKLRQHGAVSCYDHSLLVTYLSLRLAQTFHVSVDAASLVRGALLHDYFLYDWHIADKSHRFHGFHHAGRALENARRDFSLNGLEEDIIQKHMFPLNLSKRPRYRESVIVNLADKACALGEVLACGKVKNFVCELEEEVRIFSREARKTEDDEKIERSGNL